MALDTEGLIEDLLFENSFNDTLIEPIFPYQDRDSIELESVHHMFRYISEVQQESKGGYFKGKINLFESECVERFYLELSLIQGVDDEANDDFTPNLLLFTHRTRKTPIKIMPPFKAFNYNDNLSKYCDCRLVFELTSRGSKLSLLPNWPDTRTRIELSPTCLEDTNNGLQNGLQKCIRLGPGDLQLSVILPKTKLPYEGMGIQDCIKKRITNGSDKEANKALESAFKSDLKSLGKVRLRAKIFGKEVQERCFKSVQVILDQKRFHLRILDLSQIVWCTKGGHKVFIMLEAPMSSENQVYLVIGNILLDEPCTTVKVNPRLLAMTTPKFSSASLSKSCSLVLGRPESKIIKIGTPIGLEIIHHQKAHCACQMASPKQYTTRYRAGISDLKMSQTSSSNRPSRKRTSPSSGP